MKTCRSGLHQYPDDLKGCPECHRIVSSNWKRINKEKVIVINKQWYYINQDHKKANAKKWYNNNTKRHKSIGQLWKNLNKDKIAFNNKRWVTQNIEQYKQKSKLYKINNIDKFNAHAAQRRAKKLQATPKWLTQEQLYDIQEFYTLAQELAWLNNGDVLHVDHIVPLQGKSICGLHVPWNLQLLPAKLNLIKSNKFPII